MDLGKSFLNVNSWNCNWSNFWNFEIQTVTRINKAIKSKGKIKDIIHHIRQIVCSFIQYYRIGKKSS